MSFGFGVGDFLAVIELANDIRKKFSGAPQQYQAIANEVKNFSFVLQNIDTHLWENAISTEDESQILDLVSDCFKTLNDINQAISKFSHLEENGKGIRGKVKRTWERLKFEPEEITEYRSRIISSVTLLNSFADGFDRRNTAALLKNSNQVLENQQTKEVLDWLSPTDFAAQHISVARNRLDETGTWLLEHEQFMSWSNLKATNHHQVLLLQGIPGAGKTILSSLIIDMMENSIKQITGHEHGICFYYCDYNREQKLDSILLSLLRQLAMPGTATFSIAQELFEQYSRLGRRPNLSEIKNSMYAAVKTLKTTSIVVDALDECPANDGTRRALVSELLNLHQETHARLLLTSRDIPDVTDRFKSSQTIEIRASNTDIARFVESEVEASKLPSFVARSTDLQEEIKKSIIEASDGIFLLAKLQAVALRGSKSPRALRVKLESFTHGSAGYADAYSNTMKRICGQGEDRKDLALDALTWVVYAERSLTSDELLHALATEVDSSVFYDDGLSDIEDVVSACCGLMLVEKDTDLVRLVHRTAQEYLRGDGKMWLPSTHTKLSDICNTYIMIVGQAVRQSPNVPADEVIAEFPLYNYASWHGAEHARLRETPIGVEALITLDQQHSVLGPEQRAVLKYFDASKQTPHLTGLHLLAYHGVADLLPRFLQRYNVNAQDEHGRTAFWYAAEMGKLEIAKALIKSGARVDTADNQGDHPLHAARVMSVENEFAMIKLILENGEDINVKGHRGRTLLMTSADCGMHDLVVILDKYGADLTIFDDDGRTALSHVADSSFAGRKMLRYLLERLPKAEIDKPDSYGWTPIMHAASEGSNTNVRQLLRHDAAVTSTRNSYGRTLLSYAVECLFEDVAEQILEKCKMALNIPDDRGYTPLLYAVSTSNSSGIVKILLKNGADVLHANEKGMTALHLAACLGHQAIVPILYDKGLQLDQLDDAGDTALICASRQGHTKVVDLLLRLGADPSIKNIKGHTYKDPDPEFDIAEADSSTSGFTDTESDTGSEGISETSKEKLAFKVFDLRDSNENSDDDGNDDEEGESDDSSDSDSDAVTEATSDGDHGSDDGWTDDSSENKQSKKSKKKSKASKSKTKPRANTKKKEKKRQ